MLGHFTYISVFLLLVKESGVGTEPSASELAGVLNTEVHPEALKLPFEEQGLKITRVP